MEKGPQNVLKDLQSGPWTKEEEAGKGADQISGARRWRRPRVQGGRGGLGALVGGFDWGLGWPEKLVSDGQGAAARVDGGEVVLVREKAD